MAKRSNDDDAALGCIVYALLGILLIPIVGLFLVCNKDPEKRTWGWILLLVGVILWSVVSIGNT